MTPHVVLAMKVTVLGIDELNLGAKFLQLVLGKILSRARVPKSEHDGESKAWKESTHAPRRAEPEALGK